MDRERPKPAAPSAPEEPLSEWEVVAVEAAVLPGGPGDVPIVDPDRWRANARRASGR